MASGDRANTDRKPKDQKEQSERFKETARELDVDESRETFERAFKSIVPPKNRSGSS